MFRVCLATKWIGQWLKPGGNAGRFDQILVKAPTISFSFTVKAKLNGDGVEEGDARDVGSLIGSVIR
jgi:hypothetical protein